MKGRFLGFAAATVLVLPGCASRTAGNKGTQGMAGDNSAQGSSASFGTIKPGGPSVTPGSPVTLELEGSCVQIPSLTGMIKAAGSSYSWVFGTVKPTGRTVVASSGDRANSEVFTGYAFTPTATLYGTSPTGSMTIWTPGGTNGDKATTTDSTLDFATSTDGTALVSLFPSDNLPGQFEFSALPATETTVDMADVGCFLSTTPIGSAAQTKRLPLRSRQSLTTAAKKTIFLYHAGKSSLVETVRVRHQPISALKALVH